MSNNEIVENEDQNDYIEQEENSSPSSMSLFVDKIKNWLNNQNKTLVYGISGVLILAIGYIAYQYLYKIPREKEGMAAIYVTQEFFDNDSFKIVLKTAPKLADQYSGTKAGELCEYMAGASYLHTGDFKKAVEWLEKVDFNDHVLSVQSIGLLGDAYVENKDLETGLKQYLKAVSKSKNEFSSVWWRRKAAKVYEKKNDWKSALEQYETIKKDFPEDEIAPEIEKYIARAKAKLDNY